MDFLSFVDQSTCGNKQLLPSPIPSETSRYVSMFHIDGVPILPPLMTDEKSKQMKKFKEEALELERKLEERRRNQSIVSKQALAVTSAEEKKAKFSTPEFTNPAGCNTNLSQCHDDIQFEPNSYLMLSSIMNSSQELKETMDSSTCTLFDDIRGNAPSRDQLLKERMQKLQKSETLIYDNCSNTIIMNKPEEELPQRKPQRCQNSNFRQLLDNANNVYRSLSQKMPVICVEPPTPPIGSQGIGNTLSISESVESVQMRDCSKALFGDESTDESGNNEVSSPCALKAHKKVTNITAKINQFESLKDGIDDANEHHFEGPLYITPQMRSSTSPSLKRPQLTSAYAMFNSHINQIGDHVPTPLIRSNSFTLEGPSKALIDHIHNLKISPGAAVQKHAPKRSYYPSESTTRETVESKAKRVQKVELKPRSQVMRSATKPAANAAKSLRSPYELKSNRTKSIRPVKTTTPTTTTTTTPTAGSAGVRPNKSKCTLPAQQFRTNNATAARTFKVPQPEIISEIEAEHRQKFQKLIAQQQEEQMRLQQAFEAQQKLLLEELSVNMNKLHLKKVNSPSMMMTPPTTTSFTSSAENSPVSTSGNTEFPLKSSPSFSFNTSAVSSLLCEVAPSANVPPASPNGRRLCTPRRRLFSYESGDLPAVCGENTSTPTPVSTSATRRSQQRQQHLENQRRAEAATIICAYAKGFLTRRLFQTEQIQRIVQTIRDTLIFVLNLHLESKECPEEANTAANIKLKARLLQQLSSASRTLHLMFFQTSIKDRMDIIARDRKRIQFKLLSMNIKGSPRIGT